MIESTDPSVDGRPIRIEPGHRLVVLARTMQARDREFETAWAESAGSRGASETRGLGSVLYRHSSVFRSTSDAPAWSHLELRYFGGIVPATAVQAFVSGPQPAEATLLRAEILLTTPASFVLPPGWRGSADRIGRRSSLEYIDVRPDRLDAYRGIMRHHIGPAAAHLVASGRIETFRAMETAAVLYRDASLGADWNQIHLCEVDVGFQGFGPAFDDALRATAPDGGFARLFDDLDDMRSVPRWTFNDVVAGADPAIGEWGSAPSSVA